MPQDTPLPVTSKQEHDGERACPLSRPNWNGNTTRRVYPLLAVSKWDNATRRGKPLLIASELEWKHDEEGYIPSSPCQNGTTRIGMETRRGGVYPSSPCRNGNNATRRGLPLLVAFKSKREHSKEGTYPPHCVETGTTRRGGVYPSWSRSN